jgi:hypothetical protein
MNALVLRRVRFDPIVPDLTLGDHCRDCGTHLAWPKPCGVVFADGSASCLGCHEAASDRPVREVPTTVANCARWRKVRALDADGLCVTCAKEPPF